nr:hypothetical protein CFP56_58489 [Quercus suber]
MEEILDNTSMERIISKTEKLGWKKGKISLEVNQESSVQSKLLLVGKILSKKSFSRVVVRDIVIKAWNLFTEVEVSILDRNVFLFSFNHEADVRRVWDRRPWSIKGEHVILKKFRANLNLNEVDFSTTVFWVQVHVLPLNRQSKENPFKIGGFLGRTLEVDLVGNRVGVWKNFVRVRVEVDVSCPLCASFPLDQDDQGLPELWIPFKFEKLGNFCYGCGRLGHDLRSCLEEESPRTVKENVSHENYGNWLRAENNEFQPGLNPKVIGNPVTTGDDREVGTSVMNSNIVEASLRNQRVPSTIVNRNEAEERVGTVLADVSQLMGQKVGSTEHGAREGSEEILGMLSITRTSSEDMGCDISHYDTTTHLNFKPTSSPAGPNPHIDLSASKTQPKDFIQTSSYMKPPIQTSPHIDLLASKTQPKDFLQTKAQSENHSLQSNLKPNSPIKRKATNSNTSDLIAKKPKPSQMSQPSKLEFPFSVVCNNDDFSRISQTSNYDCAPSSFTKNYDSSQKNGKARKAMEKARPKAKTSLKALARMKNVDSSPLNSKIDNEERLDCSSESSLPLNIQMAEEAGLIKPHPSP